MTPKKSLAMLIVGCSLIATSALAATIGNTSASGPRNGLIGYWSFNGNDLSDKVYDRSGQGNDGYVYNAATSSLRIPGKIGQGVKFDGVDDEIWINDIPGFTGGSDVPFTFSFWMKSDGVDTNEVIGWGPSRRCRMTNVGANYGMGCTVNGDEYAVDAANSTSLASDGKWHHVVYTHDSGVQKLYFDGVLESTGSETFSTSVDNITLGFRPFGAHFGGSIDEVRVYNRAITATEAKQLYSAGSIRLSNASSSLAVSSKVSGIESDWASGDLITGSDGYPFGLGSIYMFHCNSADCSGTVDQNLLSVANFGFAATLGSNGYPLFLDRISGGILNVVRCTTASCSAKSINGISANSYAGAVVKNSDNLPAVSYGDDSQFMGMFVNCLDANCSSLGTSKILYTGDTFVDVSMAVGNDGAPIITGTDNAGYVIFTKCSNASCAATTTRVFADVLSDEVRIKKNGDNLPVIAVKDFGPLRLKVIKCADASCASTSTVTIDTDDVSNGFEFEIGSDGYPMLMYVTDANRLKFVKCTSYSCSSRVTHILDKNFSSSLNYQLALDASGFPYYVFADTSTYTVGSSTIVRCRSLSCSSPKGEQTASTLGKSQESKVGTGLVGYWSFNGPDFTDKVYNRATTSTTTTVGYVVNNATATVKTAGRIGQGIILDAFDALNDRVRIPVTTGFTGISQLSVCAWIYPSSSNLSYPNIFSVYNAGGNAGWDLYLVNDGFLPDGVGLGTSFAASGGAYYKENHPPVTPVIYYNRWSYVCATQNGDSIANLHIYVNGAEVASTITGGSGTRTADSGNPANIGIDEATAYSYNGKIDEVRVYNRAISATEIQQLYQLGK